MVRCAFERNQLCLNGKQTEEAPVIGKQRSYIVVRIYLED